MGLGELGGIVLEDRRERLGVRLAGEGPAARDHLVQHHAEGEDVGAGVGGEPPHLLG